MSTHHTVRKTLFLSQKFQKQQLRETMSLYIHNTLNRRGFAFLENNYYYYYYY
jgi:hypothetical protein